MKKIILSSVVVMALSSVAFATGGEGTGGGDGYVCRDPKTGKESTHLVDTYDLAKAGQFDGLKPSDPDAVIAAVATIMKKSNPEKIYPHPYMPGEKVDLAYVFEHRFKSLDFISHYNESLRDLPDDNIAAQEVPAGCRKVQLAIQFLNRGRVHLSGEVQNMEWLEIGLLRAHETFISLRNKPGVNTSEVRRNVARFANLLSNPRFSLRNIARAVMAPKPIPPQGSLSSVAADDLSKYCRSTLVDVEPQPNDSENVKRCRQISRRVLNDDKFEDFVRALPTVLSLPRVIFCRTTYLGANTFDWINPVAFNMVRIRGSGLAGKDSEYALVGSSTLSMERTQKNAPQFYTNRHMRQGGYANIGVFDFRGSWQTSDGFSVSVFLNNYSVATKGLYGSIQLTRPGTSGYSAYGVACYAGNAGLPIGYDFENSNY